jgi:hypothetical protein
MVKLTLEEKIQSTIKYVESLIKSGWDRGDAIKNSQNLWNLADKYMIEIEKSIPKSNI